MLDQIMQMFGIDQAEFERFKAAIQNFDQRFKAMEDKIDFLHAKHAAIGMPADKSADVTFLTDKSVAEGNRDAA